MKQRAFAVLAFQKRLEDDNWLSNVLRIDEAHFTLRGSVNCHNCRIWTSENPRTLLQTPLHDEKITVRCGFTASTVIGTLFFEEMPDSGYEVFSVTGEKYADTLQYLTIPSLADKHLLESTTFIQEGASPHIDRQVKDILRRSFGDDSVMSCHFRYACPPNFPDLYPCDYCLLGNLKLHVEEHQ